MPYGIIVIDKNGIVKRKQLNSIEQLNAIHTKCSTSKNAKKSDYPKLTTWNMTVDKKTFYIDVYGKTSGRAGFENKYELPPPIDKTLLFNSFAIVKYTKKKDDICLENMTLELWKKYYTILMGGFEDLNTDDEEDEEDELDSIPDKLKTKNGYLKDGFIVDDKADEDNNDDNDSGEEDDDDDDDNDDDEDGGEDNSDENEYVIEQDENDNKTRDGDSWKKNYDIDFNEDIDDYEDENNELQYEDYDE